MMLCSRCHKRVAVVFITAMQGEEKKNEGLCMVCAKELKIPQISEYMEQLGISDEDIEQLSDQMTDIVDGDAFQAGGSGTLPPFIQSMMDNNPFSAKPKNSAGSDDFARKKPQGEKADRTARKKEKERKLKFLENYCTNLSQRAKEGKLDRIIGRDKEISRVVQILSRRTKNNPCLIGEAGVGKTAIAEALAQRIAEGKVPYR